jgi:putative ABC transport system permease protein
MKSPDYVYSLFKRCQLKILAGILAFVIAIITLSFQSIRAALANPVKVLRSE